jgi:RNA polymerase sigma-54 factor
MSQGLSLQTRMTQSLVLAPQLQQSLALLQAPTLELKALVEQELQQNPVLEEMMDAAEEMADRRDDADTVTDLSDPTEPPADVTFDPATEKPTEAGEKSEVVDDFQAEFDHLSALDQEWRDHHAQSGPSRASAEDEERRQFMFDSLVAKTSLQERLLDQVRDSELRQELFQIAELIIGNVDDYGYLKATVDEMASSTGLAPEPIIETLKVIQSFDPAGVGARDLRECLMLQLEREDDTESLEYEIIRDYMEDLGRRRIPDIARGTGESVEVVQEAIANISRLEPRPGRAFLPDNDQFVVPEVFVVRSGDDFVVSTNNDHIPHLRISNTYKDLMSTGDKNAEVRNYIREKIRAGKFLIKSLHQRQTTITNIAREIVSRQREFMDKGVAFLKPMTMIQIADVVGVHETTVSRAVSGKYMQTPQGVYEMKYFFTAAISTSTGGASVSNKTVKDMIAEIFKVEDTSKPLSDQEVVKMLSDKGILIARRTVAKYRTELNILPSNLRKVY